MAHSLPLTRIWVVLPALAMAACATLKPAQAPPPPVKPQWVAPVPIPTDAPAKTRPASRQIAAPLPRPDQPVLALLDFESETLTPAETMGLSQSLWLQLLQPKEYGLLPRNETRRWLIANDLYPYMPYQPEVPLGRVAAALKADYLLTGRIDKIGAGYAVSIQLTGRDGQPVLKKTGQVSGGSGQLLVGVLQFSPAVRNAVLKGRPSATPTPIASARTKMKVRVRHTPVQEKTGEMKPEKPAVVETVNMAPVKTVAAEAKTTSTAVIPPPIATPTPTPAKTPRPTPAATPTPKATATPKTLTLKVTPANSPRPTATLTPSALSDNLARARALQEEVKKLPEPSASNKNDKRLELLKQAVEMAPNDMQVLRALANEYYMRGEYGPCVDTFTRALKLDPNDSILLTFRGSALYCQDKFGAASEDFRKALQISPDNHFARFNIALAAHMSKSPDAARLWREYLDKTNSVANEEEENRKLARNYLAALEKGN